MPDWRADGPEIRDGSGELLGAMRSPELADAVVRAMALCATRPPLRPSSALGGAMVALACALAVWAILWG